MTRLTAMIIQSRGDDVFCRATLSANDKYEGWICLYRNGRYDHDLLSTDAIYDTKKAAVEAMKDVVKEIRSMDLSRSHEPPPGPGTRLDREGRCLS